MRQMLKRILLCVLSCCTFIAMCPSVSAQETKGGSSDFIRASGNVLVDGDGNTFILKGMAFSNDAGTESRKTPPQNHHDEQSYAELKNMGFNSVRFYLSYKFFEDDANPYTYKQSGWDWLDQNIAWAKEQGMYLVLNMHTPQGGYQSLSGGMALWDDTANQDRLTALWTAIAQRYANEPTVVGYGLINEPSVPWRGDAATSFAQYQSLIERITAAIRTVDTNHVIFVERLINAVDTSNGTKYSSLNADNNFFKLEDSNVVYELHTYAPSAVTHGEQDWNGTAGKYAEYPNEEKQFYQAWGDDVSGDIEAKKNFTNSTNVTSWTKIESSITKVTSANQAIVTLECPKFTSGCTVSFDKIVVTKHTSTSDTGGTVIAEYNFDRSTVFSSYKAGDGSGYIASGGVDDNGGYMKLVPTADGGKLYADHDAIYIENGGFYKISGYIRTTGISGNIFSEKNVIIKLDLQNVDKAAPRTKATMQEYISEQLNFGTANNVPMYVGEFGTAVASFQNNLGGEQYVADMISILVEKNVSFNYHTYHEENFGLWTNNGVVARDACNYALANLFTNTLGDVSYVGYQTSKAVDGKYNVRFIATTNSTNYRNVGFDITAVNYSKNWNENTGTVYESISGTDKDGKVYSVTPDIYGGEYFYTMTVRGVPAYSTVFFTVKPYFTDLNGNKVYGAVMEIEVGEGLQFVDGVESEDMGMTMPW